MSFVDDAMKQRVNEKLALTLYCDQPNTHTFTHTYTHSHNTQGSPRKVFLSFGTQELFARHTKSLPTQSVKGLPRNKGNH